VLSPTTGDGGRSTVASPPPFSSSPSSPPCCPSALSSPPPGEIELLFSDFSSSSSSSLSISWTSNFFLCSLYFFVPLDCPTCSSHVTIEIPIVSVLDKSTSMIGTINYFGHSFIIYSIYSSASL
jgi:hypothetical protein